MKDILGNEIKAGDWVSYAVRIGNSAEMKFGQLLTDDGKIQGYEQEYWSPKKKWKAHSRTSHPSQIIKLSRSVIPDYIQENHIWTC